MILNSFPSSYSYVQRDLFIFCCCLQILSYISYIVCTQSNKPVPLVKQQILSLITLIEPMMNPPMSAEGLIFFSINLTAESLRRPRMLMLWLLRLSCRLLASCPEISTHRKLSTVQVTMVKPAYTKMCKMSYGDSIAQKCSGREIHYIIPPLGAPLS